jgi:hypothetical protein
VRARGLDPKDDQTVSPVFSTRFFPLESKRRVLSEKEASNAAAKFKYLADQIALMEDQSTGTAA